jgi:hypothetical protein
VGSSGGNIDYSNREKSQSVRRTVAMDIMVDQVWVSKWSDPERFHPRVQMVRKIEKEGIRHSQPIHELTDQCKSHAVLGTMIL